MVSILDDYCAYLLLWIRIFFYWRDMFQFKRYILHFVCCLFWFLIIGVYPSNFFEFIRNSLFFIELVDLLKEMLLWLLIIRLWSFFIVRFFFISWLFWFRKDYTVHLTLNFLLHHFWLFILEGLPLPLIQFEALPFLWGWFPQAKW